jgi:hypothetical protein
MQEFEVMDENMETENDQAPDPEEFSGQVFEDESEQEDTENPPAETENSDDGDEFIAIVDDTVTRSIMTSTKTKHLTAAQKDSLISTWTSKIKMFYRTLKRAANALMFYTRQLYPDVKFKVYFSNVNFFEFEKEITSAVIIADTPNLNTNVPRLSPVEKQRFSEWAIDMTPSGFRLVERFYFGTPDNRRDRKVIKSAQKLVKQIENSKVLEEVGCQSVITSPALVDTLDVDMYFANICRYFNIIDRRHTTNNVHSITDVEAASADELDRESSARIIARDSAKLAAAAPSEQVTEGEYQEDAADADYDRQAEVPVQDSGDYQQEESAPWDSQEADMAAHKTGVVYPAGSQEESAKWDPQADVQEPDMAAHETGEYPADSQEESATWDPQTDTQQPDEASQVVNEYPAEEVEVHEDDQQPVQEEAPAEPAQAPASEEVTESQIFGTDENQDPWDQPEEKEEPSPWYEHPQKVDESDLWE